MAEEVARIRREARQRAYEELIALAQNKPIDRGIGSDTYHAFALVALAIDLEYAK